MNERIKLPDQEWLGYDPERGDIHGYTSEQIHWLSDRIIQECADLFKLTFTDEQYQRRIDKTIYKHFGLDR
jgi:hypothetical protein